MATTAFSSAVDQEHLRDREAARRAARPATPAAADHEQRVQDVVAGDDARARGSGAQRVWISANSGTMKKPPNTPSSSRSTRMRQCAACAQQAQRVDRRRVGVAAGWRSTGRCANTRQADGAERHQADLDLAARQLFAQQRAGADAEREDGQQQHETTLLRRRAGSPWRKRELRQQQRAEEPEPRDAEQRQEHRAVLARERQVAQRFG